MESTCWPTAASGSQPPEWAWKWSLQSQFSGTFALAAFAAAHWEMLSQNCPAKLPEAFWPSESGKIENVWCFKLLSLDTICYTVVEHTQILIKKQNILLVWIKKNKTQDFPGSPVVKTPCLHCREHGFNPWLGNEETTCHLGWSKN